MAALGIDRPDRLFLGRKVGQHRLQPPRRDMVAEVEGGYLAQSHVRQRRLDQRGAAVAAPAALRAEGLAIAEVPLAGRADEAIVVLEVGDRRRAAAVVEIAARTQRHQRAAGDAAGDEARILEMP
ncbi:conserved hypothetical protein, partial [Ricinus communis]